MFEGLTNKGKEYMAKCLAENKPVSFAKVKIGNGTINPGENPETFIDIKSIKKEVSIVDKTQIGDTAKLTVQLDNTGVLEGYFPREIGIYVQDGGQELLYWYINDGSESSWLPPASKSPVKFKYHINLMVTNLETVIVNWSGKELWVDREYLGKELDKKLNNGNLPSIVTNAETIFKALQGNTGIKFDENLLYLNDSGTKKKGYCYIDKLTDGIFECIQETTTTVNNATYFKNFSNKENSDRLSNLKDYCDKMINGELTDFNVAHYETLVEYLEKMKQENKLHKVMYINVDTIADLSFLPERTEHELVILYYGFLGVKALCCSDRSVFLLQSWNNHDYKTLRYKQLM